MISALFVGAIGVIFIILGWLIWKKEKISLLHRYHYDKVVEKDKKAFCTVSGIGILIMGIGLIITSIIVGKNDEKKIYYIGGSPCSGKSKRR